MMKTAVRFDMIEINILYGLVDFADCYWKLIVCSLRQTVNQIGMCFISKLPLCYCFILFLSTFLRIIIVHFSSTKMNSTIAEKLSDVQRSSANQMARCQTLLKRLKVIQLQELEEYGERQMECAVKLLAETKGVKLKEAIVPDFLQKRKLPIPPADAFEEEDFVEKLDPSPPPVYTKHGLADLRDVAQMFRQNIRELLLSTIPLGTDDVDTDSCSEYEDEVQATASTNNCTNWRDDDLVYLPT